MICEGTPLDRRQKPGWCCGGKEIPIEELQRNKVRVGAREYLMPFCQVWIDEMRRRDAAYPKLNKKGG
jgi:hypothetical protein